MCKRTLSFRAFLCVTSWNHTRLVHVGKRKPKSAFTYVLFVDRLAFACDLTKHARITHAHPHAILNKRNKDTDDVFGINNMNLSIYLSLSPSSTTPRTKRSLPWRRKAPCPLCQPGHCNTSTKPEWSITKRTYFKSSQALLQISLRR